MYYSWLNYPANCCCFSTFQVSGTTMLFGDSQEVPNIRAFPTSASSDHFKIAAFKIRCREVDITGLALLNSRFCYHDPRHQGYRLFSPA